MKYAITVDSINSEYEIMSSTVDIIFSEYDMCYVNILTFIQCAI